MQIASRKLYFMGPPGKFIEIRIFAPESELSGSWSCRYEIDWPDRPRSMTAWGKDTVQALVIALNMIGSEIYTSEYHKAGELYFEKRGDGFGFPVPANLRDLLEGADAEYF